MKLCNRTTLKMREDWLETCPAGRLFECDWQMTFGDIWRGHWLNQILPATGNTCHHHASPWSAELGQQTCIRQFTSFYNHQQHITQIKPHVKMWILSLQCETSTRWSIKTCHFILVYNSCISWSMFITSAPLETEMNSQKLFVIYLFNGLMMS